MKTVTIDWGNLALIVFIICYCIGFVYVVYSDSISVNVEGINYRTIERCDNACTVLNGLAPNTLDTNCFQMCLETTRGCEG